MEEVKDTTPKEDTITTETDETPMPSVARMDPKKITLLGADGKQFQLPRHVPVEALERLAKRNCRTCFGHGTTVMYQPTKADAAGRPVPFLLNDPSTYRKVKTICTCAIRRIRTMPTEKREHFIKEHVDGYALDEPMKN